MPLQIKLSKCLAPIRRGEHRVILILIEILTLTRVRCSVDDICPYCSYIPYVHVYFFLFFLFSPFLRYPLFPCLPFPPSFLLAFRLYIFPSFFLPIFLTPFPYYPRLFSHARWLFVAKAIGSVYLSWWSINTCISGITVITFKTKSQGCLLDSAFPNAFWYQVVHGVVSSVTFWWRWCIFLPSALLALNLSAFDPLPMILLLL